jgi:REP element-mobilizing transposase RayT
MGPRKVRGTSAAAQLSLDLARRRNPNDRRGGSRPGAGRSKSPRAGVPHRARPRLSRHHPLHITLRVSPEAQNLRGSRVFRYLRRALSAARQQLGFRLTQYSVQGNHLHLIAEADDRTALTRGMRALTIRVALGINKARGRRGRVLAERYHARQLRTPLEVRRALLYVLRNDRKHRSPAGWSLPPWHLDPCSSAAQFDGWHDREWLELARAFPPEHDGSAVVARARSYLLRTGWKRHGLLGLEEQPAAERER